MSGTCPEGRAPGLQLVLFGGPVLSRGDLRVRLSPFQSGLLGVVFGEGKERTPRSLLERLLWDVGRGKDMGGERAVRHRTSQLVYKTNLRCQAKVIDIDSEFLWAGTGVVCCDLDEFRKTTGASRLQEAWTLLKQGFLATLPRQTPTALVDWAEERRLTLRAELRQRALARWEVAELSQEWATARQAASVLLGLDPRDETVLRRVMRANAMGGMVREAEALYRAFAERAEPWVPEPATSKLLAAVRAASPRSDGRRATPPAAIPEIPLVGRSAELARLARAIDRAGTRGSAAAVAVGGVQGIGKTRLAREALRAARFRGFRVLQTRASKVERPVPLGSLAEALLNEPRLGPALGRMSDPWRSAVLSQLPEAEEQLSKAGEELKRLEPADGGPKLDSALALAEMAGVPSRLLCESVFRLFEAVGRSSPLLLFVDDLHWIDAASLAVLHFVRRRWRGGGLVFVATYQPEKLHDNDPAHRFVLDVEATHRDAVLSLAPLDREASVALARSAASRSLTDPMLREIVDMAGGNPLLLFGLAAHNTRPAARIGDGRLEVPESVRRPVRRRIDALEPVAAKVASAFAVCGAPVSLETLALIVGCRPDACAEALEDLEELGLVGWNNQGFHLRNAVVGRVLYDEMRPVRRALLHAATAQALLSEPPVAELPSAEPVGSTRLDQVARHYQRAGDRERTRAYALKAAERSTSEGGAKLLRLAYDTSRGDERREIAARLARSCYRARNLEAARKFGEEALLAPAGEQSFSMPSELRLIVADARFLAGTDEAETTLAELAKLEDAFSTAGRPALVLRIQDTALHVMEGTDGAVQIESLFRRARKLASSRDKTVRRRASSLLARQAVHGSPEAGLEWGRKAAKLAHEADDAMAVFQRLVQALRASGLLATEEGRATVRHARSDARTTTDVHAHGLLLHDLAAWHLVAGSPKSATSVLAELRTLNQANDCPRLHFLELLGHGALALERGAPTDAAKVFAEARSLPATAAARRHLRRLAGMEGSILLELGRLRNAAHLAEANPLPEPTKPSQPSTPAELVLFHARLASRNGDPPSALAILERHLARTRSVRPVCWLRIALEQARLARRNERPYRDLAEQARGLAVELGLQGLAHDFLSFAK